METIQLVFAYLVEENGYALILSLIATAIALILRSDFARKNKGFYIFSATLEIVLNIPCVFLPGTEWWMRLYGVMLMIQGVIRFYEAAKMKIPKKSVLDLGSMGLGEKGQTVEIDHKTMFQLAVDGAAKGDLMQICNLGIFYRNGTGTPMNLKKSQYYFQMLCDCSDPFWQEQGREGLAETNRLIEQKRSDMGQIIKNGAKDGAKGFLGID